VSCQDYMTNHGGYATKIALEEVRASTSKAKLLANMRTGKASCTGETINVIVELVLQPYDSLVT